VRGVLTNLEMLDLAGYLFSGAIPTQLGNLSNLKELLLSYNDIHNQLSGCVPPRWN